MQTEKLTGFQDNDQARIEAYFDVGKYAEAEKRIRLCLAQEPDNAHHLANLGRALMCQDKFSDAEKALRNSLGVAPDFAWALFLLSMAYHELHNFEAELVFAKKAAANDPEDVDYLQRLADAHMQNGQTGQARTVLQQVVKLTPDAVDPYSLLGDLELHLENYAAAEKAYRNALKYEPESSMLLQNLAVSLLNQRKKRRDGIEVLYNVIQLDPGNSGAVENLFLGLKMWLDQHTLTARRKAEFDKLPAPLQHFYQDYKDRNSIFETWGTYTWVAVWVAVLGVVTFLIDLVR